MPHTDTREATLEEPIVTQTLTPPAGPTPGTGIGDKSAGYGGAGWLQGSPAGYAGAAAALGGRGVRAETPRALRAAIAEALQERRPTVIQVPIAIGGPA